MSIDEAEPLPEWSGCEGQRRVLILSATPRREGNSRRLGEAVAEGARAAGHDVAFVHLSDHIRGFLRDCRQCRDGDGQCTIDDGHERIFLDLYVPAHAVVYASPIWWYGLSGQLKAFLDRMFCYVSNSYPDADRIAGAVQGKRAALVLSAEESNLSARLGLTCQVAEMCRYLDHAFLGVVVGIGNSRSEVRDDPTAPLASARDFGQRIFDIQATDYRLDTERPAKVWGERPSHFPAQWR